MENILEHVFKLIKCFEVKAQTKTDKKKKWFLSKQYLQSLEESDDDDEALNNAQDLQPSYKKKVKCMYRAAKYGMQEGVLTGVFVGGCWGIYKYVVENFSFIILKPDKDGTEGDKKETSNNPPRNKVADNPRKSLPSTRESKNQSKNSTETSERNTRSGSVRTTEYGAGKAVRYPTSESAKANAFELVNPSRSNFRSREKVEIVGYAFIHTTGSVGTDGSSDSLKSEESDHAKNEQTVFKKESTTSKKSKSGSKTKSIENAKSKTPSRATTASKENSVTSGTKVKSTILSSRESQSSKIKEKSKSKVIEVLEEFPSPDRFPGSVYSMSQDSHHSKAEDSPRSRAGESTHSKAEDSHRSKAGDSRHSRITGSKVNTPEHTSPVKTGSVLASSLYSSKHSRGSQAVVEEEPSSEVKDTRYSSKASSKSDARSRKSSQDRYQSSPKPTGPSQSVLENIIPEPENSPSVLVDVDQISNGYTSVVTPSAQNLSKQQSRSGVMSARVSSVPITEASHTRSDYKYSISNISEIGAVEQSRSQTSEAIPAEYSKSFFSEPSTERGRSRTSGFVPSRQKSRISETILSTPERTSDEEYSEYHKSNKPEEFEQEPEPQYFRYGEMEKSNSSFVKNIATASVDNARSFISRTGGQDNRSITEESGGFSLLSAVNDNIIVFSACNCAIVLGVVCTVISTTRASLSI